ncbi:MAG: ABC transporter ATP-binding protein [Granulosicoccus sp.]|nr:ABC transporter ATP-binding protein [Granulosicoccus sp.]
MTTAVQFENTSRHFGDIKAVDDVSLNIEEGEFFALLGPSGSGKTTCLRLIAGFERPTSGQVSIFGEDVREIPPYKRNVNTVFQDYALFPHLNVLDNVAYPLMIRKMGKQERYRQAEESLSMVQLGDYGQRKPSQLSGGQRQRVALARALVNKPKVLLLDEPLGALDLKLREEMQEELRTLQRSLGITFIFVTHDQSEALSMSDRIAIFNEGKIIQSGSPQEVYHRPGNAFVANFVGSSNVLSPTDSAKFGYAESSASLRPEAIRLADSGGYAAVVQSKSFLGTAIRLVLDCQGTRLVALVDHKDGTINVGQQVNVNWNRDDLHLMDTADG